MKLLATMSLNLAIELSAVHKNFSFYDARRLYRELCRVENPIKEVKLWGRGGGVGSVLILLRGTHSVEAWSCIVTESETELRLNKWH